VKRWGFQFQMNKEMVLLQKIEFEPNAMGKYEVPGNFWYEVFTIFANILIPIIIIILIVYGIVKFYKMFQKMNDTLAEISETLKKSK